MNRKNYDMLILSDYKELSLKTKRYSNNKSLYKKNI